MSTEKMTCKQANQIDLVNYLVDLGHQPVKVRNNDYWYLSPLRDEKTASFKVNRKINAWYDFGTGEGGTLVDFAVLYHKCTIAELLKMLDNNFSFQQPVQPTPRPEPNKEEKISIRETKMIQSPALYYYLHQRRIPLPIAQQFCQEVSYEISGRPYYAIGFKNDLGGYELRNPYFKGSSSPKHITTIHNNARKVCVFEGFFDFLSLLAIIGNQEPLLSDYVVLNSLSFFEKARPVIEQYEAIHLLLDNNVAGQNCSRYACSLSTKYKDESYMYRNHEDLNDWVVNIGKGTTQNDHRQTSTLRQRKNNL